MNAKAVIAPILLLALLTGCATSNPAASGTVSPPAAIRTDSGTEASEAPGVTGTAPTAAGGGTTGAEQGKTASKEDTEQVLNDILNQLDQLDRLYSELDEVSEDDLELNE